MIGVCLVALVVINWASQTTTYVHVRVSHNPHLSAGRQQSLLQINDLYAKRIASWFVIALCITTSVYKYVKCRELWEGIL